MTKELELLLSMQQQLILALRSHAESVNSLTEEFIDSLIKYATQNRNEPLLIMLHGFLLRAQKINSDHRKRIDFLSEAIEGQNDSVPTKQ